MVAQESKWRGASGRDRHRLIRAAPSYEHFVHSAPRRDWGERINPNASLIKVLTEAERTTDESVSVIAVDMPVALRPVRARRRCDKSISKAFGGRGCSTHSPTEQRPGVISDSFFQDALEAGFSLRTDYSDKHGGALLEVYPHVALLELCNSQFRLRYKLSRRRAYWPKSSPEEGREEIRHEWDRILAGLKSKMDMDLEIDRNINSLREWKAWEDVIDAIICCWVGLEWLSGKAKPYGDAEAAIWVPVAPHRRVLQRKRQRRGAPAQRSRVQDA